MLADPSVTREDLKTFFGPRAEVYLKLYDRALAGKNLFAWSISWWVLLFGFVWFFYRRMYIYGAMVLLAPIVSTVLFGGTGLAGAWGGMAAVAKPLYYGWAFKRVVKANKLGLMGAERADYLRRAGGVSVVAGSLAGVLFAALAAIILAPLFIDTASLK